MTGPLTVRRMTFDDLDPVMVVERRAYRSPWSEDLVRRELDHPWSTVLVAVLSEAGEDGVVVPRLAGFIIYWLVVDEVHVLNVACDPDLRRRGIANALMEAAETDGRVRGAVMSTLEVRRSNGAAQGLYERRGYRTVGVRPRYYQDDGEDAFVMVKDLSLAAKSPAEPVKQGN